MQANMPAFYLFLSFFSVSTLAKYVYALPYLNSDALILRNFSTNILIFEKTTKAFPLILLEGEIIQVLSQFLFGVEPGFENTHKFPHTTQQKDRPKPKTTLPRFIHVQVFLLVKTKRSYLGITL